MCLIKKSVHCLTNSLLIAMDEAGFDAELAVFNGGGRDCCEIGGACAPPRVITVINCFCTSVQLICVFDNTLLHKSIRLCLLVWFDRFSFVFLFFFCLLLVMFDCVSNQSRVWI